MRRAVRHGRLLGITGRSCARRAAVVIDLMGEAYPYVDERRDEILDAIEAEEEKFARTLEAGSARLDELVAAGGAISGADAFRLHDTFGFPIDLTIEMAAERGVAVDRAGFDAAMAEQRERSRGEKRGGAGARPGGRRAAQRVHRLSERDERRRPARPRRRAGRAGPPSCSTERRSTRRAAGRSATAGS